MDGDDTCPAGEPTELVPLVEEVGSATQQKTRHASERDTPATQQKREAWRTQGAEIDPARFVFVDERGVTRSMTRGYGRAPKGPRVPGAVPLGH